MDNMRDKPIDMNPEMRNLLMDIFQTEDEDELRRIASNAQRYQQLFRSKPPVNVRNAGRKARFTDNDIAAIESMYMNGTGIQEIASHFKTTRQTISKYITPTKRINRNKFITMRMQYMYEDELCTTIDIDYMNKKIYIQNHTDDIIHRAFGVVKKPSWTDFEQFLESRCLPRTRANVKSILRDMGLSFYDPIQIIEKTEGRMAEDKQWIKITYLSKKG